MKKDRRSMEEKRRIMRKKLAASKQKQRSSKKVFRVGTPFAHGLAMIQKSINKLMTSLDGSYEYMKVYSCILYYSTQHNYSEVLYAQYKGSLDEYISSMVMPSLINKHDELLLRELIEKIEDYKVMVLWLSLWFKYLDVGYVTDQFPTLSEVAETCFFNLVYKGLNVKVRDAIISLIRQERNNVQIDRALLKNILDIFVDVGNGSMDYYRYDFELPMLEETFAYYSQKGSQWLWKYFYPEYIAEAEECIEREKNRTAYYLHVSSENKVLERVRNALLIDCGSKVPTKEDSLCYLLLRNDRVDDLSRIFNLFFDAPEGVKPVSNIFKQTIISEGSALVEEAKFIAEEERDAKIAYQVLVNSVIRLHEKYLTYVTGCFMNHSFFHQALTEAFRVLCNKRKAVHGSSFAEILATICNDVLKHFCEAEINDFFDKVVKLLAYVSDTDLFFEMHCGYLADRLIANRWTYTNLETSILSKISHQSDRDIMRKMRQMVTDLETSKAGNAKFQNSRSWNPCRCPQIEFNVSFLRKPFWPSYISDNLKFPTDVQDLLDLFKGSFSPSKTNGIRLAWINSLGSCVLNAVFETKTIELSVSVYQATLLLLFNDSDTLTFGEIQNKLSLKHDVITRVLNSLACAEHKILKKKPDTEAISEEDIFEFNTKFTNESGRLTVRIPDSSVEYEEEVRRKHQFYTVGALRDYAYDAKIMHILKHNHGALDHKDLVESCAKEFKFELDLKRFMERIEKLVIRDFIERLGDPPGSYKYVP